MKRNTIIYYYHVLMQLYLLLYRIQEKMSLQICCDFHQMI